MKRLIVFGWFFFVMNFSGDPAWMLGPFTSKEDCATQRTWVVNAHFKTATPDATAAANYAGSCFQKYDLLQ